MTKAREAEMHYIKEQNDLEIKKSSEMAEIESTKFQQMVTSIGAETIQSIATAGPDMQVGLSLSMSYLFFQVSLPNPRTLSHKSSFIPRTCNLWNVLPSSCFPESYNLPSFKSKIDRFDLISLSSQPFAVFFLPLLRHCIGHHGLSPT